jgi:hypothetical protein
LTASTECLSAIEETLERACAQLTDAERTAGWNEEKLGWFTDLLKRLRDDLLRGRAREFRGSLARELNFWGILEGELVSRAADIDLLCNEVDDQLRM